MFVVCLLFVCCCWLLLVVGSLLVVGCCFFFDVFVLLYVCVGCRLSVCVAFCMLSVMC